jgi:hypothetical protein
LNPSTNGTVNYTRYFEFGFAAERMDSNLHMQKIIYIRLLLIVNDRASQRGKAKGTDRSKGLAEKVNHNLKLRELRIGKTNKELLSDPLTMRTIVV